MNRIKEKSFKNLISIKNKTIDILKQYIGNKLSKMKRTQLQNTSWFNEKSKNNIMQDITNFLNSSINILEKGDFTPNSTLHITSNKKNFIKDIINAKTPKRKSNLDKNDISLKGKQLLNIPKTNFKLINNYGGFRQNNEIQFRSVSSKNNLLSLNYKHRLLNVKNKLINKSFNKNNIDEKKTKNDSEKVEKSNKNLNNKSIFSKKSNTTRSNNTKKVKFKLEKKETESLSKALKESSLDESLTSSEDISSGLTRQEEKITTISEIYSQEESFIRKKIKSSTQKEKILKLCKSQKKLIESLEKKITEKSQSDELKKINELNNMIYSRLLEYSDTEVKNEKTGENKGINKKEYKIEKALNFSIK